MCKNKFKNVWWKNGIRFQCQGSGNCCCTHGEYNFVYLTPKERNKLAKHLKLSLKDFTKKYCQFSDELYHLKSRSSGHCIFFNKKSKRCEIYPLRPFQCRTGPFWPETLVSKKVWKADVESICPGINKGKLFTSKKISSLLKEHDKWEDQLAETEK